MVRANRFGDRDLEIGQEIRRRREALDLNQTRFGELFGLSYQQIGKYEKGQDSMRVPLWEAFDRALRELESGRPGFAEAAQTTFQPPPVRHPAKDQLLAMAKTLEAEAKRLRELSDSLS